MPTSQLYVYKSHHVLCLCAITPDANDLHGKRDSCDNRFDALGQPPSLNRLPDLLAVDIVALCFQI
jgi:hypothetical protein